MPFEIVKTNVKNALSNLPNQPELELVDSKLKRQWLPNKDVKAWHYLTNGIKAEGHSPAYKIHKYFARRPHNVFRNLIENYTTEGDLVYDPFCGGGVTVFEGLLTNRRVAAKDLNPLATFITQCQARHIDTLHAVAEFSE